MEKDEVFAKTVELNKAYDFDKILVKAVWLFAAFFIVCIAYVAPDLIAYIRAH